MYETMQKMKIKGDQIFFQKMIQGFMYGKKLVDAYEMLEKTLIFGIYVKKEIVIKLRDFVKNSNVNNKKEILYQLETKIDQMRNQNKTLSIKENFNSSNIQRQRGSYRQRNQNQYRKTGKLSKESDPFIPKSYKNKKNYQRSNRYNKENQYGANKYFPKK